MRVRFTVMRPQGWQGPNVRGVRRLALALAALALPAAGCGLQAASPPGGVELTVTSDFGGRPALDTPSPRRADGDTLLRLLRRDARVGSLPKGSIHVNGTAPEGDPSVRDGDR